MLNMNDVVSGLEVVESKRFSDSRFSGDIEYVEVSELQEFTLIPISLERGEGFLAVDSEYNCYLVLVNQSQYMGETQYSYSIQSLTLQGVNWCIKYIVELNESRKSLLNEVFNNELRNNGINVDTQELGELSALNTMFNVYILMFETDSFKYWITFRKIDDFWVLKKITKKVIDIPVKPKNKGLNLNII